MTTKDQLKKEARETMEIFELACEELFELRGYLVSIDGKFNPDVEELKKYCQSPKPEYEKKLSSLKINNLISEYIDKAHAAGVEEGLEKAKEIEEDGTLDKHFPKIYEETAPYAGGGDVTIEDQML